MSDKEFVSNYIKALWENQSAGRYGINGCFYLDDYSVDKDGVVDRIFIVDSRHRHTKEKDTFQYFDISSVATDIAYKLKKEDKNEYTITCGQNDAWGHMMCMLRDLKDEGVIEPSIGSFEKMEAIKRKEAKQAVNEEPKLRNKQKMSI